MKTPKLSIVLPALNSINYIRQCVNSILSQTMTDFELLCIDAGSTDGTLEAFQEYAAKDNRVRVIPSDRKSYGYQVNTGIDAARGTYLGIVESDDFIDPHMYEDLLALTQNSTIDVVKGNFYFYYDFLPDNPYSEEEEVRETLPEKTPAFTVLEQPLILKGHPSIWSAIYRLDFLREQNIRLMELPGGGWTDNPFFFETLCSAKSICWTKKPYYYYRCSNPDSSSNKLPDLTMPIRRMMDNLDVTDRYELSPQCLKQVYERGMIYLHGSVLDLTYDSQETTVREQALAMVQRMDQKIIDRYLDGWYRSIYYSYSSPVMLKRPRSGKILLYDYMPEDRWNKCITFSEKRTEQLRRLLNARMDIDIYVLTVRRTNSRILPMSTLEKLFNKISQRITPIDVINQEELSVDLYEQVLRKCGPFDLIWFITDKGLDSKMKDRIHGMSGTTAEAETTALAGKETYVNTFEELLEGVRHFPVQGDVTFTSEEYQRILQESDYLHRVLEETDYGKRLEEPDFQRIEKRRLKQEHRKRKQAELQSGWQCVKDHGLLYTIRLYLSRRSE